VFGIDSQELAVIALVALVVIGPRDLPRLMRIVGQWIAKGQAMTRHVRAGFDTMMREAEIEEMQKAWAAQNEAIIKASALPDLGLKSTLAAASDSVIGDDWMAPLPPDIPVSVAAESPPEPPPEPSVAAAGEAASPRRRRKAAAASTTETPETAAAVPAADEPVPAPLRKRTARPRVATGSAPPDASEAPEAPGA